MEWIPKGRFGNSSPPITIQSAPVTVQSTVEQSSNTRISKSQFSNIQEPVLIPTSKVPGQSTNGSSLSFT